MVTATVMVDSAGRVVIPAKYRQALGVDGGGELVLVLENDKLQLQSKSVSRAMARKAVRDLVPQSVSLVDELSQERSQEVD